MSSPLLPDVNVWVALNYQKHMHHPAASQWYDALPDEATLVFCRQTQLGLFRILTTLAVMGKEILSQRDCWQVYDGWIGTGQVAWADEPPDLDILLRASTEENTASPKAWMVAYLAAFAEAAHLTLVTFDRALAAKAKGAVLLG
jgi:uncharacterized protein